MANPYTDVRAITARLGQVRPAGSTPAGSLNPSVPTRSTEAIQLGRAANKFAIQNPQLRAEIERIANGSRSEKPSGLMGTILGNPITKTALKGLEAFALPGRAVVAASRELVDAFDGNDKTKASFGDFGRNVKDSTYGFGKAFHIDTGNKWLDRAIGFAGDIALDPLTYATFGASAGFKAAEGAADAARVGLKTAGYGNRVTLANRVLAKTGDKALAKAISIDGRSALSRVANGNEILERVGANKFGVYFFGKRVKVGANGMGWRVPLSGTIGEIGEATLAKARLAITNTRMGKYMQKMTMPKDFLNLRLAAARGALNPEDTAMALKLFDAVPKQRLARASAQQAIEQQLMNVLKAEEGNLEAYRGSIYRLLEDPAKLAAASEPEKRAVAVWRAHLDQQWESVAGRWKEVDEAAELGKTENYFPRVRSDEAEKFMNSEAAHAADVRGVFMEDPFALPGAFTPRSLRPGKKWFGYVLKDTDMSVERLNQIARQQGGIDFDFFETDVVNAMKKYASDTADEIGIIERNAALKEAGFFDKIQEMRVRELEINEDDIAHTKQLLDEQNNILVGVEQDFRQSVIDLTDNVRAEATRVAQGLATSERLTSDMGKYLYDMLDDVARKVETVNQAKARLMSLFGPETSIPMYALSDDFPVMMRPMLAEFDAMANDLAEYQTIISDLHAQSMKEGYDATSAEEALRQIEEAATATQARLKESQESMKAVMEIGNALEGSWESIVNGGLGARVEGSVAQQVIKDVRGILGARSSANAARTKRAQALGVTGKLKDWMRNSLNPNVANDASADFYKSFWDEIAGAGQAGIKPSAVTDMSEEKFFSIILNAASPEANVVDLRQAAAYAIGRDIRLYNAKSIDDLPRFVRRFHEELRTILKEAEFDEAQRVARGRAGKNLQSKLENLKNRWGAQYDEAVNMKNTLDEYSSVAKFIRVNVAEQLGEGWENIEFTESLIPALEEAAGGKRLPWMYDYIDDADIVLGKQSGDVVTLGDIINHVDYKSSQLSSAYYDDTIEFEDVISANLAQNQGGAGISVKTREEFVTDYETKVRQARKAERVEINRATEFDMSKGAKRRMRSSTVGDEVAVKTELAEKLVQYQAVSDAVQKFEAIASVLAPHGMIPDENMWRGILRTVSNQYGSQYQDKVRRIIVGEEKFIEFYAGFTKKLQEMKRLPAEEQVPISALFKESLEDLMSGSDAEIMSEILGPTMSRLVDKTDMGMDIKALSSAVRSAEPGAAKEAAKLRYDKYVETYVIPWAKSVDPTITGKKGPAVNMLKDALNTEGNVIRTISKKTLRDLRTPLSRDASEMDVYNWFNSMLKTVDTQTGETIAPGAIAQMRSSYQGSEIFFRRMKDGYLDVEDFFKTLDGSSNTPAGYATQMIELANMLDGAAQFSGYTKVDTLAEIGTDYKQINKTGDKAVKRLTAEADKTAKAAEAARQVADAFKNPNLTHEELKGIGFGNQVMREAYDYVADLLRFEASGDYAMAMNDLDMVNFLDAVSGVNFAQFDEGIVVGTNRVQKFTDDVIPESSASVEAVREKVQGQLDELASQEAASRAKVLEPYTFQRNGKTQWKSAEHRRAAQMKLDNWASTEQGKFRSERIRLQGLMDSAESRVVASTREAAGFEDVPVFAKMPDGTNITFTQAEWDSLYIPPYTEKGLGEIGAATRAAIKEKKKVEGLLNKALEAPASTWDPAKKRYIRSLEKRVNKLDEEIKGLEAKIERNMKVNRNAALEKVRILVKQLQEATPQDGGAHWMNQWSDITDQLSARTMSTGNILIDEDWTKRLPYRVIPDTAGEVKRGYANNTLSYYFKKLADTDQTVTRVPAAWGTVENGLQGRRNSLQALWRSNPSHAVLQEREELARLAAMTGYDDFERYAKQMEKAASKARQAADDARVAVDDVQASFKKAIDEMRNAELQAAKAAGATFDTKTPFWATNKEVKYVLNGKEYSVPSVSDMLQDPVKYIKRARQRGDLFFDMKKPGNVVLWNEATDEARASMALFGLQTVLLRDTASVVKANVVNPSFARSNETYNIMLQWSQDAKTLADNIRNVREAIALERQAAFSDYADSLAESGLYGEAKQVRKKVTIDGVEQYVYETTTGPKLDVFEFAAELRASLADFDPSIELSPNGMMQMETLVSALRKRSQLMERVVQGMPSKADNTALAASKKPATRAKWMQVHLDWINNNRAALRALAQADLSDAGEAKIWNSFLNAFAAEARFTLQEGRVRAASSAVDTAKAGVYVDRVLKPATEEFNKAVNDLLQAQGRQVASDFNMPGYSVSSQVNELIGNLKRINDGAVLRELGSFMSSYTGFFKAYATLSPGFHVRNSISNTFQLFAAGAEVKNMRTGLKLWRSLGEHVKGGGNLESWLASGAVPKGLETQARVAGEVALALGGGKIDDAFAEFMTVGRNVVTDNAALRASRSFGQRVEGSARFMLAFDSAQKGMDFNSAFNHTGRYLFDYHNPTLLDESVKGILPFWTWMSRNLPIQITTQWTNPKPYVVYKRFANNFMVQDDEQLPDYVKDKNPIQLGKGTFLTPDLPFMSAQETVNLAENPRKALSMLNPGLRVPMELAGGRQFFTGREFGDQPGQQSGTEYAMQNLLPMLGQIDRVTKTGPTSDNLGFARYLGIPVRGQTDAGRNNELQRPLYELSDYVNKNGGK